MSLSQNVPPLTPIQVVKRPTENVQIAQARQRLGSRLSQPEQAGGDHALSLPHVKAVAQRLLGHTQRLPMRTRETVEESGPRFATVGYYQVRSQHSICVGVMRVGDRGVHKAMVRTENKEGALTDPVRESLDESLLKRPRGSSVLRLPVVLRGL